MPKIKEDRDEAFLGLDPGKQGGICLIDYSGRVLFYEPMPESVQDIWNMIETPLLTQYNVIACIEFVSYFPTMGGVGAFSFGGNYYALQMALTAARLPYEIVRPIIWQKVFNIPSKGGNTNKHRAEHKERLRQTAQRWFPKLPLWKEARALGKQRAICDALLLAEYKRRKHTYK